VLVSFDTAPVWLQEAPASALRELRESATTRL